LKSTRRCHLWTLPLCAAALLLAASSVPGTETLKNKPVKRPQQSGTPPASRSDRLQALLPRMATLKQELQVLQGRLQSLRAIKEADPEKRAARFDQLAGRLDALAGQLDQLSAQLEALPPETFPNLAGMNLDSLATALARQMERNFPESVPPGPAPERPVPAPNRVDWRPKIRAMPLPTVVERALDTTIALAPEVQRVALEHKYGDVRVEPGEGRAVQVKAEVTVQGTMSQKEGEALARQVRIAAAQGSTCSLEATIPSLRGRGDQAIRVDLVVRVPSDLAFAVKNSYGDLTLAGLKGSLEAGVVYGDLQARDIGTARLSVNVGDARIERVTGTLHLESRYGTSWIQEASQAVSVEGLSADVTLHATRGRATLDTRYGSLTIRDEDGPVSITGFTTTIGVQGVKGAVSINSQYGQAQVSQISGALSAQCLGGTLTSSFVEQPQDLQTRYTQVEVNNPGGDVKIIGESAPILLRVPESGGSSRHYELTSRYGNLTLEIPQGSSASIQAAANSGTIYSDIPLRRSDAGDWQRGEAVLGKGAASITVQAISGSIRISTVGR